MSTESVRAGADHLRRILSSGKVGFTPIQDGAECCSLVRAMNLHGVAVLASRENLLQEASWAEFLASQEKRMDMTVYVCSRDLPQ